MEAGEVFNYGPGAGAVAAAHPSSRVDGFGPYYVGVLALRLRTCAFILERCAVSAFDAYS